MLTQPSSSLYRSIHARSACILIFFLLCALEVTAQQSVGIGTNTPNPKSVLELVSPGQNQGFLLPRLSTTEINAIPAVASDRGLMVFDHVTNEVKYWNGAVWLSLGLAGGGITGLNGLITASQTFATGTTGTNFNITSAGSTHTFNFPDASASARGLLTSTDWSTFNNKLGTSLANGNIWIGNGSNTANAVTLSGDATLSNSGVLSLANSGVTAGTFGSGTQIPVFSVDSKGRITSAGTMAISGLLPSGTSGLTLRHDGTNWVANNTLFNNGTNVGVGTTSPTEKLQVSGGNLLVLDTTGNAGWIKGFDDHHSIYFREGNSNRTNYYQFAGPLAGGFGHRFLTGGFKNSQTLRLQIADDGIYIPGNVGIGTASPTDALHLVGTAGNTLRIEDGTQAAGRVLTSDANGNATWATPASSGWSLTGNAGTNPTTNFIGTTDNNPIRLRVNNIPSGYVGTSDYTFYGFQAGQNNTGGGNTGFGHRALATVSTAFENTAVGNNAQENLTTGIWNVAVGSGALRQLNTANYNTAVGTLALANVLGNWSNSALGSEALMFTKGSGNSAIGRGAGQYDSLGDFNTYLGFGTGPDTSLTLTNATAIGAATKLKQSNTLILGQGVNVGIGTSLPSQRLEVVGNVRFSGALMPGNQPGAAGEVLTSAGPGLPPTWSAAGASGWALAGNAGTNPVTNFIGTTDSQPLNFRTNNNNRLSISNIGKVTINEVPVFEEYSLQIQAGQTSGLDNGIAIRRNSFNNFSNASIAFKTFTLGGDSSSGFISIKNDELLDRGLQFMTTTGGLPANAILFNFRDPTTAQVMSILRNGNTAIGNMTPTERLHVEGNVRFSGALMPNNQPGTSGQVLTSNGAGSAPTWQNAGGSGWGLTGNAGTNPATNFIGTTDVQALVFRSNNIEYARLTALGRLGINTNSPVARVHIEAASDLSQDAFEITNARDNVGSSLPIGLSVTAAGQTYGVNTFGRFIRMTHTNYGGVYDQGIDDNGSFFITPDGTYLAPFFTINNTGRIGLGIKNPASRLDLNGDLRLAPMAAPGVTANKLYNVGGNLFWNGTNISSGGSGWGLTGNAGTNPATNFIGTTDAQSFRIRTNNIERVSILPTGFLGIGTTSPVTSLHVQSPESRLAYFQTDNVADRTSALEIRSQGSSAGWLMGVGGLGNGIGLTNNQLYFQSEIGNTDFIISNGTGRVGIGTTNPRTRLQIGGRMGLISSSTESFTALSRNGIFISTIAIILFTSTMELLVYFLCRMTELNLGFTLLGLPMAL